MVQRVNLKNIATMVGATIFAGVLFLATAMWAQTLLPALAARKGIKARNAPLIAQAKELGLTYETVFLTAPAKTVGKPAVWCLRRISPWETLYQGKEGKSVYIENPHGMLNPGGSMHQTCTDTLVTIKSITALDYGTVRSVRLEVSFIDYP